MQCESHAKQRQQMERHFRAILMDVQQKSGLQTVLLERKLAQMGGEYERVQTVLAEVLKLTGVEPQTVCGKVEAFLRRKNDRIGQLELEFARVAKAYEDLLDVYEQQLDKIGVPKDAHGFHSVQCLAPLSFRGDSGRKSADEEKSSTGSADVATGNEARSTEQTDE